MLGNGSLTVGLNEEGLVHDFYYPYVGLDNLTTARSAQHKIGVWVDKKFSWVDDGSWDIEVTFDDDALISTVTMKNRKLAVTITSRDFVDSELNVFYRRFSVSNQATTKREVRLFIHQVFQISRAGRADTALFVPEENYILDYKGRCSLLIYGVTDKGQVYDQFAVGIYDIEDKEGTFRDAEDGELSGNAVEHGGVDSVIRFVLPIAAGKSAAVDYWIVVADSQFSAERIHHRIKEEGFDKRLTLNRQFWHEWLDPAKHIIHRIDIKYRPEVKKSLMLIKAHIDKRGGIIASCDSSIYNYGRDYYSYVWPRDGAFVIWPLIRMGITEEPKKFFEFCRDIMAPDGYMMHKYQPDKAIGSTWHPLLHGRRKELAIQEDETAIIIYMLGEFYTHTYDTDFVRNLYTTFIQPAGNFLSSFIDDQTKLPHASYDLWEEKFLTNTYTTFLVYQALQVAAEFAELFEFPDDAVTWTATAEDILRNIDTLFDDKQQAYRKGFLLQEDGSLAFDDTLDVSSMYGAMMFGNPHQTNDHLKATVKTIETKLFDQSPSGGAPRYLNDTYFASSPPYLGNPWIVTSLWMAQYYSRHQQPDQAKQVLDWALKHALPSGVLPEQVNPADGSPISVAPLVWSHAELVNTVLDVTHASKPRD